MTLRPEILDDPPAADVFTLLSDPLFRTTCAQTIGVLSPGLSSRPPGAGAISGRTAAAGRTRRTLEVGVVLKAPLVGGKLEALTAGFLADGKTEEHSADVEWLAGRR